MEIINNIIKFFTNLNINNLIDILIGLTIIIFFIIISSPLTYIIIRIFNIKQKKTKIKSNGFFKPLRLFFILLGFYLAFVFFNLPKDVFEIITKIFRICTILLITKGFANLFDNDSNTFAKIREKLHFHGNDTTISFMSRIIKTLIYIVAGFILISEFGYDLSGLATGLGISSVVIALAAQDIAKSILSGFSILSDKPFEIGDTIEINGLIGTVEDITFRTTRIRNVDNQIIVLPNSNLVSANIINYTMIKKRRYSLTLILNLDTPLDKVSDLTREY